MVKWRWFCWPLWYIFFPEGFWPIHDLLVIFAIDAVAHFTRDREPDTASGTLDNG